MTAKVEAGGNSAAAMLLSLNFILLSFFIMLVAIASTHKGRKDLALAGVAAQFEQPHEQGTPQPPGAFLPHSGSSAWQPQLSTQLLGMVPNLLPVPTPEMETDANRLVVKLPGKSVFNGAGLNEAAKKAIPNLLQLAVSSQTSPEVWVGDDGVDTSTLQKRLKALAAVAGAVPLGIERGSEVRLVYRMSGAPSKENLGRLPGTAHQAGGEVHGESK